VRRQGVRVLVVPLDGVGVLPTFQFDARGSLRPELAELVEALQSALLGSWRTWSFLVSSNGRLSGGTPVLVAVSEPARAARAVQRMVEDLRGPGTG
jgi:hypothetical protein